MAQKYAKGSRAWGICGRGGHRVLLKDMVFDGRFPNMRVDPAWYEDKHPQEFMPEVEDPTALYRPSPEVIAAPTAPVLTASLQGGTTAQLTWTPAESGITEIASYSIFRGLDGVLPTLLITCAVLRDFLGGIVSVQHCTTTPSIPVDDTSDQPRPGDSSGSVFDKLTNEDAPVTYLDVGLSSGHTYAYYVVANPMGNNQSVGQGPPSPPSNTQSVTASGGGTGLVWTNRGQPTGNPIISLLSDGAGNVYAVDGNLQVLKSTDGGHTWAVIGTIPDADGIIPTTIEWGNFLLSQGVLLYGGLPHDGPIDGLVGCARSSDGGVTWNITANVGIATAGFLPMASNQAGTVIAWANVVGGTQSVYARSLDNGVTWGDQSDPLSGGTGESPLWDGTQFVSLGLSNPSFEALLLTNPDGDPTHWSSVTYTGTFATPSILTRINGLYVTIGFTIPDSFAAVMSAPTFAGLATATPHLVDTNFFPTGVHGKPGLFFAFGDDGLGNGLVANSADLVTWVRGTLNMAALEEVIDQALVAYDPVHDSFVAGGNAGTICTYP